MDLVECSLNICCFDDLPGIRFFPELLQYGFFFIVTQLLVVRRIFLPAKLFQSLLPIPYPFDFDKHFWVI